MGRSSKIDGRPFGVLLKARSCHFFQMCHNFFQSCHGKGPSDSEGGVVEQNLRHCEFKRKIQINSSEDAYKQG